MAFQRRNVLFGILSLPASTLLSGRPLPGLTATVYNGYEFHTAIRAAGPGSSIMLAPGNYGDLGSFVLTSSNLSVRVQNLHRAVLRSPLIVNGDLVELDGLGFEEGIHLIGKGVSVTQTKATGKGIKATGVSPTISGNDIGNYSGTAINIEATATGANVFNNKIHDALKGAKNAVQVGDSTRTTNIQVRARITNNIVWNCRSGSTETFSFKSSSNSITGNRLTNCNNIAQRHGEGNNYSNNVLVGCQGIVIQDARTVVSNNTLTNSFGPGIQVMAGNTSYNNQKQGDHPQAAFTVVTGNKASLWIGRAHSGYNYPAINTRVDKHTGTIKLGFQTGTSLPGKAAT